MADSNRVPHPSPRNGDDWETVALRRVSARVAEFPSSPQEAEDFGWEEGVLEKLRKRLAGAE